jgi:hypothetical protein
MNRGNPPPVKKTCVAYYLRPTQSFTQDKARFPRIAAPKHSRNKGKRKGRGSQENPNPR